nr:MAG TPA: hypothetical protein [Caudoviricetes sp.]
MVIQFLFLPHQGTDRGVLIFLKYMLTYVI